MPPHSKTKEMMQTCLIYLHVISLVEEERFEEGKCVASGGLDFLIDRQLQH